MLKPVAGAFARILGALNLWMWPVLLFVAAFPFLAYYWGNWGPHWKGEVLTLYGPANMGGVAALLSHPVSSDPLRGDGEVEWTLHLDPDSAATVDSVFLRYRLGNPEPGLSDSPDGSVARLQAVRIRQWKGSLAIPKVAEDAFFHIELSLHRKEGGHLRESWPLGWRRAVKSDSSAARNQSR